MTSISLQPVVPRIIADKDVVFISITDLAETKVESKDILPTPQQFMIVSPFKSHGRCGAAPGQVAIRAPFRIHLIPPSHSDDPTNGLFLFEFALEFVGPGENHGKFVFHAASTGMFGGIFDGPFAGSCLPSFV